MVILVLFASYISKNHKGDLSGRQALCSVSFFPDLWRVLTSYFFFIPVTETTAEIVCIICKDGRSSRPNEIVLCDKCGIGRLKTSVRRLYSEADGLLSGVSE